MVRAAALALILVATPAVAAPDQFDLDCSGTTRTQTVSTDKTEPFTRHYRIDLESKRWCAADCGAVHPIAEVQESYLKLEPGSDEYTPEGRKTFTSMISRTTGAETVTYAVTGRDLYTSESRAQCRAAAFSGFPKLDKQF